MIKQAMKAITAVGVTVVTIPYAVAFLANILYGWPDVEDKYKRAFHPKKVLTLNYALLKQITNVRYLKLFVRWKYFYKFASHSEIHKAIPYGTNNNELDLYVPKAIKNGGRTGLKPVIVFVYGGTWSSGDKDMYPLLCSEISNKMNAVVCCPNYSIYPKGMVDDMVQDIGDCLRWLHGNVDYYGGDKESLILVGHSAGAHLCAMATLDLVMRRLMYDPQSLVIPESSKSMVTSGILESIRFDEKHFDSSSENGNGSRQMTPPLLQGLDSAGTSGSFFYVEGHDKAEDKNSEDEKKLSTSSFLVVEQSETAEVTESESKQEEHSPLGSDEELIEKDETEKLEKEGASLQDTEAKEMLVLTEEDKTEEPVTEKEAPSEEKSDVSEKMETDLSDSKETEGSQGKETTFDVYMREGGASLSGEVFSEKNLSRSQRETRDLLSSIKAVIGLAGVYDIAEHYKFEYMRGVEDISAMTRAMYGQEAFHRFSPTLIVKELPRNIRIPPFQLVHGEQDTTVPLSSSQSFGQALFDAGSVVSLTVIPECSHIDVCLDLMDPKRNFYDAVMGVILSTSSKYL